MVTVPRLFPGSTVVCMATGPSLTQEDADYVRGRCPVIAVNFAVEKAPWAEVLYSSDRLWWPKTKGWPGFGGQRYSVGSRIGKANPFHGHPNIHVLTNTGFDGIETDPSGLRNGRSSGYAAVNLAVHLGADRIILLGYNMGSGGRLHFYDERPGFMAHPGLYPNWRRSFDTMVEPLKALGVEVINCTENTSLTTFPCWPLRQVLTARGVAA